MIRDWVLGVSRYWPLQRTSTFTFYSLACRDFCRAPSPAGPPHNLPGLLFCPLHVEPGTHRRQKHHKAPVLHTKHLVPMTNCSPAGSHEHQHLIYFLLSPQECGMKAQGWSVRSSATCVFVYLFLRVTPPSRSSDHTAPFQLQEQCSSYPADIKLRVVVPLNSQADDPSTPDTSMWVRRLPTLFFSNNCVTIVS